MNAEVEEILQRPFVICDVCGSKSTRGAVQNRCYLTSKGKPVIVKKFMCHKCLEAGEPWPGNKPSGFVSDLEILGEQEKSNKGIDRIAYAVSELNKKKRHERLQRGITEGTP